MNFDWREALNQLDTNPEDFFEQVKQAYFSSPPCVRQGHDYDIIGDVETEDSYGYEIFCPACGDIRKVLYE